VGVVLVVVAGNAVGAWLRDRDGGTQATIARAAPVRTLLIEETRRFELSVSPVDPELLNPIPDLKPVAIGHTTSPALAPTAERS
jgi:hypothetical protein